MDTQAVKTKMDQLYQRARAARKEGKRQLASTFKAGARRLQRQLRAEQIKQAQLAKSQKKKEGEEG